MLLAAVYTFLTLASAFSSASKAICKCTPNSHCWPSEYEWISLNTTLHGALIRGVPPGSVCYPNQPNFDAEACRSVASQWFNSSWHAQNPVSIDYPIWVNNSCNPIWPNGTSVTGDAGAGEKGCSMGAYPAYVINATRPEQISAALRWAGKMNIRVVLKSTGHSYTGRSVGYGGLSIWTHYMRGLAYIETFEPVACPIDERLAALRVAAGHTGIEAQTEAAKYGAAVVTGANPDVGLVGWLTGGGHGALSRTYGMGTDNLLEATIVTPTGEIVTANPCKHTDIFYAIRGGGGGTFGVITEVVIKAFPTPKTTSHNFKLVSLSSNASEEFWNFVGFLHADMPRLKEGGMQGYYFIAGPPLVPTLSLQWIFMLYNKPEDIVETLMAPIEAYLGSRSHSLWYQSIIKHADTFLGVYDGVVTNELVANGGSAYGSRLMSPESLADPSMTAKTFEAIGPSADLSHSNSPLSTPIIMIGHFIANPSPPTYYPSVISLNPVWRKTLTHLIIVSTWPDGIQQSLIDKVYQDVTRNKTEALRKLCPDGGAYFNEADSNEPEWQTSFFGQNYARLKKIKRQYDPRNVLWCRKCVGSEHLIEQVDGSLCRPLHDEDLEDDYKEL